LSRERGDGMGPSPRLELASPDQARDEGNEEQHDENKEQDLRDPHGAGGDTPEAEDCSDDGDDKKHNGVMQHDFLSWTAARS